MALISVEQAKAWLEPTKLQHPDLLDSELYGHAETEVLARISAVYDISTWLSQDTTPPLVQTILAKVYAGWYYERTYSEDNGANDNVWATKILSNAEMLIGGITDGTIPIPTLGPSVTTQPIFYPNDASSAQDPRDNDGADTSLGDAKFSMGQVF